MKLSIRDYLNLIGSKFDIAEEQRDSDEMLRLIDLLITVLKEKKKDIEDICKNTKFGS